MAEREEACALLGAHVASAYRGRSVLVVGNPFAADPARPEEVRRFESAGVAGLKRGVAQGAAWLGVVPAPLEEAPVADLESRVGGTLETPLSYLMPQDAFTRIAVRSPAAGVLVSLVGLPLGIERSVAWQRGQLPPLVCVLPDFRVLGTRAAVLEAYRSGRIGAVLVRRSAGETGDRAGAANERYLIVTRSNVTAWMESNPPVAPAR